MNEVNLLFKHKSEMTYFIDGQQSIDHISVMMFQWYFKTKIPNFHDDSEHDEFGRQHNMGRLLLLT